MSAQVEPVQDVAPATESPKSGIGSFFDSLVGTVMVILMAIGLVTLTLTWRTSEVRFESDGSLLVTQSTWWGFQTEDATYSAAGSNGWTIERENGDRVPLSNQSIRLRN